MVIFYKFKPPLIKTLVEIYIHRPTTQDNGTNIDRPLTDWNSLPHFSKTLGQNKLFKLIRNKENYSKLKNILLQ